MDDLAQPSDQRLSGPPGRVSDLPLSKNPFTYSRAHGNRDAAGLVRS